MQGVVFSGTMLIAGLDSAQAVLEVTGYLRTLKKDILRIYNMSPLLQVLV